MRVNKTPSESLVCCFLGDGFMDVFLFFSGNQQNITKHHKPSSKYRVDHENILLEGRHQNTWVSLSWVVWYVLVTYDWEILANSGKKTYWRIVWAGHFCIWVRNYFEYKQWKWIGHIEDIARIPNLQSSKMLEPRLGHVMNHAFTEIHNVISK